VKAFRENSHLIPNWYKACGNVDHRGGIFKTSYSWLNVAEECLPAAFFFTAKRSKSPSRPEEKSLRLCCGCPMGRIVKTYDRTSLQFVPGKVIRPCSSGLVAEPSRSHPCSGGFF